MVTKRLLLYSRQIIKKYAYCYQVTRLPVSYICTSQCACNYRNNGYQMVTVPKLILQTLRKIPTVTKLPGYQLHLYYPTCMQLLYKTMITNGY